MTERTEQIRTGIADFLTGAITREQFDDPQFPYDVADEIVDGWDLPGFDDGDQPDRDELQTATRAYLATLNREDLPE